MRDMIILYKMTVGLLSELFAVCGSKTSVASKSDDILTENVRTRSTNFHPRVVSVAANM